MYTVKSRLIYMPGGFFMDIFDFSRARQLLSPFYAFREKYGLSGAVLKTFAIISMLVDHTAATAVRAVASHASRTDPELYRSLNRLYFYMRRFGRLAFPIFCFFVVEGFFRTRDVKKYALRMFCFALLSEFPFDYALHHNQPFTAKQNVYFTLLIGLLVMWGATMMKGMIALQAMVMAMGMITSFYLRTDYSYHGVFLIEMLFILRSWPLLQSLAGGSYMYWYERTPTQFAFIPLLLYNGKRGRQIKHLFYLFYPAHHLILGLITYQVLPRIF